MVGMVVVSHSRALAESIVKLVSQVASPDTPITLAAGVGDDRQTFGTDATEIMEAIERVFSPDGVLILMDIGSAVLSAQMALDLMPPEISSKVLVCSAPLIEGAIAAAVQINLGSSLEAVANEARQAIMPKQSMIGDVSVVEEKIPDAGVPHAHELSEKVTLVNLHGLHARPAARFVQKASEFKSTITVKNLTNGKGPVSARSLNAIATLGAIENHLIEITANGDDAENAIRILKTMIEEGFGERLAENADKQKTQPVKDLDHSARKSIPISEGFAVGPLFIYEAPKPDIPQEPAEDTQKEWDKLRAAIESTRREIDTRIKKLKNSISQDDLDIFTAHQLILQDPEISNMAYKEIFSYHKNAAVAWDKAIQQMADNYRVLDDPYLQQRAADVVDVGNQVLHFILSDKAPQFIVLDQPVILFADDLTPSETSQLDLDRVLGIITSKGGPTSHSAILARGLGIPAVVDGSFTNKNPKQGDLVGVDGFAGKIYFKPDQTTKTEILGKRDAWIAGQKKLLQSSQDSAITQDGCRVEIFANIGNVNDARIAMQNGAEGVGLLRTEFMFLTRETAPDEEEQFTALSQIYAELGKFRPITVRTMDVGGDKQLPYIDLPEEDNPFLGMRALRLSLEKPELLFMPQLRAILRAANGYTCRIMFPMVAALEEIQSARKWVEKAHQDLSGEGVPHAWPAEVGIMVEIPSAALISDRLAKHVDFFSIGTNDLTQYSLAAERGNPSLSYLADGLHPAVLQLIGKVCRSAHAEGKWVGVCGELGGNPEAMPILIGLGVDELSMNAPSIPRAKNIVRALQKSVAVELANRAVTASTSEEVHNLVKEFNQKG
jgi:phosphocarrier protein FPr